MVKTALSVKHPSSTELLARGLFERLGGETGAFRVKECRFHTRFPKGVGHEWDMVLKVECPGQSGRIVLLVDCKKQLSPRIALGLLESMAGPPSGASMMVFSPSISARVAEICRERNVGYLDAAGNCLLRAPGLYIERSGRGNTRPDTRPLRRLFAEKSSRVTRALLTQPRQGWQVQKLAAAAHVSLGLASKVKQALLAEGYAIEQDRMLFVRDARQLLDAWARAHRPPVEPLRLYVPGAPANVETTIAGWLERHSVPYALTQFSGAWRAAAMVRYARATMWVGPLPPAAWADFRKSTSGEQVDSGENAVLWQTDDPAVFSGARTLGDPPLPTVSPVQLYLDLKLLAGRGEEAVEAVYQRELAAVFAGTEPRETRAQAPINEKSICSDR